MPIRNERGLPCFKICIIGPYDGPKDFLKGILQRPGQLQINELSANKTQKNDPDKTVMLSFLYEHPQFQIFCCTVKRAIHDRKRYNYILDLADAVIFVWDCIPEHWNANLDAFNNFIHYMGSKLMANEQGQSDVAFLCCAINRNVLDATPLEKIRDVMCTAKIYNAFVWEIPALTTPHIKRPFVHVQRDLILKSYFRIQEGTSTTENNSEILTKFFNRFDAFEMDDEDLLFLTSAGWPIILNPDELPRGFKEYLASLKK